MSFTCVCPGLNAGKPPAPQQRVRFLLGPVEGSEEKELTLTATSVPSLANHPLGKAHSGRVGVTSQEIAVQSQCPSRYSDSCPRPLEGHSGDEVFGKEYANFSKYFRLCRLRSAIVVQKQL